MNIGDRIIFLITAFFAAAGTKTIIGLIVVDFFSGVAASLRKVPRTFQWRKLANFYMSNVAPFIMLYGALYVGVGLVDPSLMGGYADVVSESLRNMVWAAIIYHLIMSILTNLQEMGVDLGRKVITLFLLCFKSFL